MLGFSAIRACGWAGECDQALSLLQEMPGKGVRPDGTTFAAAISACGVAGRWERGLELLSEMPDVGFHPTVACYTSGEESGTPYSLFFPGRGFSFGCCLFSWVGSSATQRHAGTV